MKRLFFTLLLIAPLTLSVAQKSINIVFGEKEYDFGTIKESNGKVTHVFTFENKGNRPFTIKQVTASCGCTSPTWSKEPIAVNGKGSITVTFNPEDRPGTFRKSISVVVGNSISDINETLYITGEVSPKPLRIEDEFPYTIGNLRLKQNILNFGTILKGNNGIQYLEVYNNSESTINLALDPNYAYLKTSKEAQAISPKSRAKIAVTFVSNLTNHWGYMTENVPSIINQKTDQPLAIRAIIKEDFSKLTQKERLNAPIAQFSAKVINLTTIKAGERRAGKISLKNNGNTTLYIRNIISESDYLVLTPAKKEVKPGKSIEIKVEVDARKLPPLKFRKEIQIITNDPALPTSTLSIEWLVVK